MIKYSIQKNIPTAKYAKGKLQATINYPLEDMKPGESFKTEDVYSKQMASRIRGRVNLIKGRSNLPQAEFSVAKDPNSNKIRVWRIK